MKMTLMYVTMYIVDGLCAISHKAVSPDEVERREPDVVFDEDCEVLGCCQQSRPA